MPSPYDYALFVCQTNQGIIILLLYVDDVVITGDDTIGIQNVKACLSKKFEMKDLGPLRYFLGIEVESSPHGYILSQVKYASDLIAKAGLTDNKSVDTPLEMNTKLHPNDGAPLEEATLYRQLVGSLIYPTITRLDIAHSVNVMSQFLTAPCTIHFAAVLRILRYLRRTLYKGLLFSSTSKLKLHAFSDSDWVGDVNDRHSTTGYCVFLGNSLISLKSKK